MNDDASLSTAGALPASSSVTASAPQPVDDVQPLVIGATVPIRLRPAAERTAWISENWEPFLARIKELSAEVKQRTESNYGPEARLPSQEEFRDLSAKCRDLTAQWYGRPNISIVYQFLITVSEVAGIEAAYALGDVPTLQSSDGFVMAMDGSSRGSAFAAADKLYEDLIQRGTMPQKAGASDIDATVLPNVLDPGSAKVLLGSGMAKAFIVGSLRSLQRTMLRKIAISLGKPADALLAMPGSKLLPLLKSLTDEQLAAAKVRRENPAFRSLIRTGKPVEDFGQINPEAQKKIQAFIRNDITLRHEEERAEAHHLERSETDIPMLHLMEHDHEEDVHADPIPLRRFMSAPPEPALGHFLNKSAEHALQPVPELMAPVGEIPIPPRAMTPEPSTPSSVASPTSLRSRSPSPSPALDKLFASFLKWLQENPGRYYNDSEEEHRRLLVLGLWTDRLAAIKRSVIERMTLHRYTSIHWTRIHGSMLAEEDGTLSVLRHAGTREYSRLRKNAFPYAQLHGLGLLSGGIPEDTSDQKLLKELGCHLDPGAKTPNWFNCDIEKIAVEAAAVSPLVPQSDLLPGDRYLNVGQNPKIGSSIGATLHTHLVQGSVQDYPIYALVNKPVWCPKVGAEVDVIQVGATEDAFYIKFWIDSDANPAMCGAVRFLMDVRAKMVLVAGRKTDFVARALPDAVRGGLVMVLVVLGDLWEDKNLGASENKFTGEWTTDKKYPVINFDLSISGGGLLVKKEDRWAAAMEGRPALERLYDWARYPGARDIVDTVLKQAGYEDPRNGKTL